MRSVLQLCARQSSSDTCYVVTVVRAYLLMPSCCLACQRRSLPPATTPCRVPATCVERIPAAPGKHVERSRRLFLPTRACTACTDGSCDRRMLQVGMPQRHSVGRHKALLVWLDTIEGELCLAGRSYRLHRGQQIQCQGVLRPQPFLTPPDRRAAAVTPLSRSSNGSGPAAASSTPGGARGVKAQQRVVLVGRRGHKHCNAPCTLN